jgi:hypothetical protein
MVLFERQPEITNLLATDRDARERPLSPDAPLFAVEKILKQRMRAGILEYKVRWMGCGPSADTWEPASNLTLAGDVIREFELAASAVADTVCEVHKIVAHRRLGAEVEYLVRWTGYEAGDDTWMVASQLSLASVVLQSYRSANGI